MAKVPAPAHALGTLHSSKQLSRYPLAFPTDSSFPRPPVCLTSGPSCDGPLGHPHPASLQSLGTPVLLEELIPPVGCSLISVKWGEKKKKKVKQVVFKAKAKKLNLLWESILLLGLVLMCQVQKRKASAGTKAPGCGRPG